MPIVRMLAAATAVFAYLLVALSPIVRITGSGMGCGDHWPLCNGRLIPRLDNLAVMIEWGHRLAVVGLTALVVALLATAWAFRRAPGVSGAGGVLRPAALAAVLLVAQSLLGAVTVWLELPPAVVVAHLLNAMALLAATVLAALRAVRMPRPAAEAGLGRASMVAAGLAGLALLLGALTANLHAGAACQGFPLCGGRLWPAPGSGALVHLHWMHRVSAYALGLYVLAFAIAAWHRRAPGPQRLAAGLTVALLAAQVAVAALMVQEFLPIGLRAAHAAVGALLWTAVVYAAWMFRPVGLGDRRARAP